MARWRCNACKGVYDDVSADGVAYHHACPPVRDKLGRWVLPEGGRDENIRPGIVTLADPAGRPGRGIDSLGQEVPLVGGAPPMIAEGKGRTRLEP